MFVPDNSLNKLRWLPIRNDHTTEAIPPYGICACLRSLFAFPSDSNVVFVENQAVLRVTKPPTNPTAIAGAGGGSTWPRAFMVNGPHEVQPGKYGIATFDSPVYARMQQPSSATYTGSPYGPRPGFWDLWPGYEGFTFLGGHVSINPALGQSRGMFLQRVATEYFCFTTTGIAKGSSASCELRLAMSTSSGSIMVLNEHLPNIAANKKLTAQLFGPYWIATSAET